MKKLLRLEVLVLALTYSIDRTKVIEDVTKAGQKLATRFVPYELVDSQGNDFREMDGNMECL